MLMESRLTTMINLGFAADPDEIAFVVVLNGRGFRPKEHKKPKERKKPSDNDGEMAGHVDC